ncbi:MAG: methyltransferase domain-containing protein [Betaproteobacteria bacterium]
MTNDRDIAGHYSQGKLLQRLTAALAGDGVDAAHPTIDALRPYDQFHGRGFEATVEMADSLEVAATDRLLDVGSGIGGPARYFAHRYGCAVTGIDLTAEFCDVARVLTRWVGLDGKVAFQCGNALAMPFANDHFDGAYSMNVSMNISDRAGLYRETHRVLKPGGWLMLSELAKGAGGELDYPTPWANTADTSFLSTPEETQQGLVDAGFDVVRLHDTLEKTLTSIAATRAMVERGEQPPHRAVQLIHGDSAKQAMANTARGLTEARIVPIEVLCTKRR